MGRDTNANSQLATYLGTAGDYCPPLSGSALEEAMAITSVKDIMTEVVEALRVGDSLDLADRIMRVGRIRHLPVVDGDDHLVGLVTHRTILAAWVSHGSPTSERSSEVARDIPIEMVMVKDVLTTTPEASAADASTAACRSSQAASWSESSPRPTSSASPAFTSSSNSPPRNRRADGPSAASDPAG